MTESTDHKGVPAKARPTVFHHEGRRLFVVNGEARIVDLDMAQQTGLKRERKIRDVIRAQRSNLAFFGSLLRIDADLRTVSEIGADGETELPFAGAILDEVFRLLESEGVLDSSRPGKQPVVWLLNRDQMRWIVGKSRTPESDEFLRELFRVYKAWEDGTLEPARPAVEPPKAPEALPPPADPAPVAAIVFHGIVYEMVGDSLYVLDESLYRAGGYSPARMRAIYTDLPAVGAMPRAASLSGALLLSARHVDFLSAALRVDYEERLAVGFVAALQVLRAHALGRVEVVAGTLAGHMGPDGVSREYAAGRAGGRHPAPGWIVRLDGLPPV